MKKKIISRRKAAQLGRQCRDEKLKMVFTNGCFDILHVGHVKYLHAARRLGDVLVLGLNTDDSVQRLKGPKRPINKEKDRAHVIAALECVDHVVLFDEDTPYELIAALKPNVLVKGSDYKHGEIVGEDVVRAAGGTVRRIKLEKGFSTSQLIKKIKRS